MILLLKFDEGGWDGGEGAAEFLKSDDNFVFALDLNEFAHEAFEGPLADGDGFARCERFEGELHGFVRELAHEAEAFNLLVGDGDGFVKFAYEGDGAVDVEDVAKIGFEDSDKDVAVYHWNDDFLDAVAPFALDGLQG